MNRRQDSKPLRYLLMATHVPASGSGGGMVRYTVELASALSRRGDIELHVLAQKESADFFATLLPRGQIHLLPALPIGMRSLAERFGTALPVSPNRFDVVHGAKHLLPRHAGGAVRVLTVHDMLPLDRPQDFGRLKRNLLRFPYLASIGDADVLACVSLATAARLCDYDPRALARSTVIPLAAPRQLRDVTPALIPELSGRRFAFVVGDASARKNVALAVQTWPEVRVSEPDAVLVLVGPISWAGEKRGNRWEEQIADGAIRHLGHISDEQLAWCYRNAAVVLCPSLLEGFGLPTVEAAALGAHVITSEDPALCEASAEDAMHVPSWQTDRWIGAVSTALRRTSHRVGTAASPASSSVAPRSAADAERRHRTWDDVAEETVTAIRDRTKARVARPAARALRARIGLDPYTAPLRVLHVRGPDAPWSRSVLDELAMRHRAEGWQVDIVNLSDSASRLEPDLALATKRGAVDVPDAIVFHGLIAARFRHSVRGGAAVVVVAGSARPRSPRSLLRELRLAWKSNVMVVDSTVARYWARAVTVPLTCLSPPAVPLSDDWCREFAAILVRARAWGVTPPMSDLAPPGSLPVSSAESLDGRRELRR